MRRQSSARVEAFARIHRSTLTFTEQALWAEIRGARLGVWFRRQVAIGSFIVDFLAPSEKLIIEVDGGYHSTRDVADQRRDRKLARLGYRVLRIDAALIRLDITAAVARVREAINSV